MVLVRKNNYWDPFSELIRLQEEMNDLFDVSFSGAAKKTNGLLDRSWGPAVDVFESKDDFVVKADLPGLSKDEIDVTVEKNVLTIRGEKMHDDIDKNYIRSERFYGTFNRVLSLPAEIDAEKVSAKYENGTLELNLPKREESKPKQISIDIK